MLWIPGCFTVILNILFKHPYEASADDDLQVWFLVGWSLSVNPGSIFPSRMLHWSEFLNVSFQDLFQLSVADCCIHQSLSL